MKKILFFLLLIVFVRVDDKCMDSFNPSKKSDCFSVSTSNDQKLQCCFVDFKSQEYPDHSPSCYEFEKGKSNADLVEIFKEGYPDATNIKVICEGDPIEDEHTNNTSYLKIGLLFILGLLF